MAVAFIGIIGGILYVTRKKPGPGEGDVHESKKIKVTTYDFILG